MGTYGKIMTIQAAVTMMMIVFSRLRTGTSGMLVNMVMKNEVP
jgi:hypothetical protein